MRTVCCPHCGEEVPFGMSHPCNQTHGIVEVVSLGAAFPREQERCRDLLVEYAKIGPASTFARIHIEAALRHADEAAISGDPVAMLRAYEELKGCA